MRAGWFRALEPFVDWIAPPSVANAYTTNRDPVIAELSPTQGLVAFRGNLRMFGTSESVTASIEAWNDHAGWRQAYGRLADGLTFFAESSFGTQFASDGRQVVAFDPETGSTDRIADTVTDWVASILADRDEWLWQWLADMWALQHGPLPVDRYLIPRIPFALGGDYSIENLVIWPRVAAMEARGALATQIRGLPPGSKVLLTFDQPSTN